MSMWQQMKRQARSMCNTIERLYRRMQIGKLELEQRKQFQYIIKDSEIGIGTQLTITNNK
jgi:hypothetical protein